MRLRIPILLIAAVLLGYGAILFSGVGSPAEDPSPLPVLDSSRTRPRRPFEAKDPLPPAPVAAPQDLKLITEGIALMIQVAETRRGACGNPYIGGGRFLLERDMFGREWRLLAQAYPAAAERVAETIIATSSQTFERHAAFAMVSELASRGGRRAEQLLVRNAGTDIHSLSDSDPQRLYQDTYRKEWSFGNKWACGLLDYVVDPKVIEQLQKISSNPTEPDFIREDADKALARLRILGRPDLKERLTDILEQRPSRGDRQEEIRREEECRWALDIVRMRKIDVRAVLRRCLDRNLAVARGGEWQDLAQFAEMYRVDVHLFPRDWDEALVTYVELGGLPNALERDRLREFGYLCDPKERVTELLRHHADVVRQKNNVKPRQG